MINILDIGGISDEPCISIDMANKNKTQAANQKVEWKHLNSLFRE